MKILISHDVDHIHVFEHINDLIIPKFLIRSLIEFTMLKISASEFYYRISDIFKNKWQNIEELMLYDKENNIKSTFFIGVENGLGLKYSLKHAEFWCNKIIEKGFNIGVHGISFDCFEKIQKEYKMFEKITNLKNFGIRMHYLRTSKNTINFLDQAGYLFDSSEYELKNPYKIGHMWEFPLSIMDGNIFYHNQRWQNVSLFKAKENTKRLIEFAFNKNLMYFNILFHDRYFCNGFSQWENWYIWLVEYLKNNKFKFISYIDAISELENNYSI